MRRIVFILTLLAALAAAASASGAVMLAKSCHNTCSTLQAGGKGWLSVVGNGAEWGTISSGTVWVRDRTGKSDPRKWVHGSGLTWKSIGDDGYRGTSKHSMRLRSGGQKFWIKLQGPGIQVSGVFDGSGRVAGSGSYTVNTHTHSWPKHATELHF
jgi:hypothetical protein